VQKASATASVSSPNEGKQMLLYFNKFGRGGRGTVHHRRYLTDKPTPINSRCLLSDSYPIIKDESLTNLTRSPMSWLDCLKMRLEQGKNTCRKKTSVPENYYTGFCKVFAKYEGHPTSSSNLNISAQGVWHRSKCKQHQRMNLCPMF